MPGILYGPGEPKGRAESYIFVLLCPIMIRTLIYIISLYFLYKFIFEFLVPLFRATNKIQRDMRSMQQKMEEQMNAQRNSKEPAGRENTQPSRPPNHEYIDFEEVKK